MKTAGKNRGNNKAQIVRYILEHGNASKAEIAKVLDLSMPTVLQNTKELVEQGIVAEVGEYESTGGRKAKSLALRGEHAFVLGLDITANHISMVLVNLTGDVLSHQRKRKTFKNSLDYCREIAAELDGFLESAGRCSPVLGVGVSLPGIVDDQNKILLKSHALKLENVSLRIMEQLIPFPVCFENDANAAMAAEKIHLKEDAVYLSLSNTVGGAICMNGELFRGSARKAGEFGHMVIVPGGRPCYCGKKGCADAYCSPLVLTSAIGDSLDSFMDKVGRRDPSVMAIWEEYLDYLAIMITNLRMAFDTAIILGGYVGGYMEDYMFELGKKVLSYNLFDSDVSYLKNCFYKREGSAVGAAWHFIDEFVDRL